MKRRVLRRALGLATLSAITAAVAIWRMPEIAAWQWYLHSGKPELTTRRPDLSAGLRWFDGYYAVADLGGNAFAIGEPLYGQCNFSYLVIGTTRALVFDTGPGVHDIAPVVRALTSLPVIALPSHLHFDHVGGLGGFTDIALPDLPALRAQAHDGVFSFGFYQFLGFVEGFKRGDLRVTRWIQPNSGIDLGDRRLEMLSVPGHTADSVVLWDAAADRLFSGDFIYPSQIYAYLPGASLHDYSASAERLGGRHRVHVKVDTGMHRMGVDPTGVDDVVDVLAASPAIDLEGLYTHFSVADGSSADDRRFTRSQIERFDVVVAALADRGISPRIVHAANSAGALGYPGARYGMVRIGLALYGYLPEGWLSSALVEQGLSLETALTLRARVVAVRRVAAGERPSYGRRRALDRAATVATVPFGYADGYPRRLFDTGAQVLINAKRYELAGNVTMDQLLIDCDDDEVAPGDDVVLLGRQGDQEITAEEWATRADTITWEILCGIGARVPRVLVD